MRKLVLFLHLSFDGFSAAEDGGLGWIPYNEAFEKYAEKIVKTVGTPVYGRITYEMMRSYWPTVLTNPAASAHDREHALWLEDVEKIVVSTTLPEQEWNNTRVIREDVVEEIIKLKQKEGKDLVIFGSITLATSLMAHGLIDEFQFTVSPVMLGKGKTFIRSIEEKVPLKLLSSETLKSGIVGLHYAVVR
ncbi:MAG: dihydrofolate reductase [Candidatus Kaiserbacteria bacterium]|nr:dihydrofolate reductase [Candidatus Kaiserbacteria bacterium]